MVSIDVATPANGCLEIVAGKHKEGMLPTAPDDTVDPEFAKTLNWEYLETEHGDIVLFDLYISHKSGPNTSDRPRRAFYITYNKECEGSYREEHYKR